MTLSRGNSVSKRLLTITIKIIGYFGIFPCDSWPVCLVGLDLVPISCFTFVNISFSSFFEFTFFSRFFFSLVLCILIGNTPVWPLTFCAVLAFDISFVVFADCDKISLLALKLLDMIVIFSDLCFNFPLSCFLSVIVDDSLIARHVSATGLITLNNCFVGKCKSHSSANNIFLNSFCNLSNSAFPFFRNSFFCCSKSISPTNLTGVTQGFLINDIRLFHVLFNHFLCDCFWSALYGRFVLVHGLLDESLKAILFNEELLKLFNAETWHNFGLDRSCFEPITEVA